MKRWAFVILLASVARGQNAEVSEHNARGVEFQQQNRYADAEMEFQAALDLCRPSQCPRLAAILNNLGSLYYMTARYSRAEPVLKEAIERSSDRPEDGGSLASALANLAALYRAQARYGEAAPLYERALELRRKDPAAEPFEIPKLQAQIALLAQDAGDLVRADQMIRVALQAFEDRGATDTLGGAAILTDFAAILEAEAMAHEAQLQLERALAIRQRLLGAMDPAVAVTLSKLGQAHRLQNHLSAAEKMYRAALTIERGQAPSPELAETLNNLGTVLQSERRWKEAEAQMRAAISVWEKLLGPDHPSVAAGLGNLADLFQSQHRYDDAARALARSLEIDQKSLPPGHMRIGLDLNTAATLAYRRKQYAKAESLYLSSIDILAKALRPGHPQLGLVFGNLAEVYRVQKRWADSAATFRRAVQILVQAWGPDDERLLVSLERYAQVLRQSGDFAEAGKIDVQSTRIRTIHALHPDAA